MGESTAVMKRKIAAFFHDPGGASLAFPVLQKLQSDNAVSLQSWIGPFRRQMFTDSRVPTELLSSHFTMEQAGDLLTESRPDCILTGTSWASNSEQMIRNVASQRGISSFVMIDYWANFASRWAQSSYTLKESEDRIFCLDEGMKDDMIAEGFRDELLIVTGHPTLEILEAKSVEQRTADSQLKVLFVSEPFEKDHFAGLQAHPFEAFLSALSSVKQKLGSGTTKIHLDIKLHPKEEDWSGALTELPIKYNFPFRFLSKSQVMLDIFPNYDVVVGYQSMALFEARSLGVKAFAMVKPRGTLSPSLYKALSAYGIVTTPLDNEALAENLLLCLQRSNEDYARPRMHQGAISRVLQALSNR